MEQLAEAQAKLAAVEAKILTLEAQYTEATDKKAALAQQVADCQVKLQRADKLIGGLGGERQRWEETVTKLGADMRNVVGDVLVASGMIAYSGPFTPAFRAMLLKSWSEGLVTGGVAHTSGGSLISTLQDPVAIRTWTIAGLPTDN